MNTEEANFFTKHKDKIVTILAGIGAALFLLVVFWLVGNPN
jgi:type II secretory pathway component PulM